MRKLLLSGMAPPSDRAAPGTGQHTAAVPAFTPGSHYAAGTSNTPSAGSETLYASTVTAGVPAVTDYGSSAGQSAVTRGYQRKRVAGANSAGLGAVVNISLNVL